MDEKLMWACVGKSESQGGMNIEEFRQALMKMYPKKSEKIKSISSRKSLQRYCQQVSPEIKKDIKEAKEAYFVKGTPLNQKQMKYCRCIAHVAGKNKDWCYKHKAWKKGKGKCYNPYAVCTSKIGRKGRIRCTEYYDLDDMPKKEVEAISKLKGKTVPELRKYIKERAK